MATEVAVQQPGGTLGETTLGPPRSSTFHSLRYRDYRYLWQGQIGAAASNWMEQIARPLLIYSLTDSAFLVGAIAATRMFPMLFIGVWAGVMADRMDKRKILLVTKTITLAVHAITAALLLSGVIEPWMVFVTAFTAGSAMAFDQPARQSLIPHMVPPESIANAVALNSAAMNVMRVGGPSIAGLILAAFDFGALYVVQSVIYVWVIFSMLQIKTRTNDEPRSETSLLSDLKEGFRAASSDKAILYILLLSLALFIWGMPFQGVFVPLIVIEELGYGRTTVGLMLSSVGAGALLGSLIVATYGDTMRKRGVLMIAQVLLFALSLLVFANAMSLFLAVPALMLAGAMQVSFMSINNAYVLGRTPRELQGRVMSLFSLDRGLVPFGALIGGLLAESLDAQMGLTLMASICLVCTIVITLAVPALRRIQ